MVEGVSDDLIIKWHKVVKTLIAETSKDFTLMINIQEVAEQTQILIDEKREQQEKGGPDQIQIMRCNQNEYQFLMNNGNSNNNTH